MTLPMPDLEAYLVRSAEVLSAMAGPDLANWLSDHGREKLGGRPFGDGTPPPPPKPAEVVPAGHGAA